MDAILIISFGILIGCLISLSWFAGSDAPFVATRSQRIKKMLKELPLRKKTFFELGSGDGRVVIEAARLGALSYGIEQSWLRVFWSKWKARKIKKAKFIHGNIFKKDFYFADIVFIYLLPKAVNKLESILRKKLKKGSIVVTQTFHFKHWRPYKKLLISDQKPNKIISKEGLLEGDFRFYKQV